MPDKLAYSVEEAAGLLSISKRKLYQLILANQIGSIKIGSRRLVRRVDLEKYVNDAAEGAA